MKESLKQVPWLSVVLILLVGVLCSIGIRHFRSAQIPTEPLSEEVQQEAAHHNLTFLNEGGEVLAELQCKDHGFVLPPEQSSQEDGIVFRGWNQPLYDIRRSTELTPRYQDLSGEKNVFYIDSLYTQPGDQIEQNLWLAGEVSLCQGELTLNYDPTVLKDLSCDVQESPFLILSQEPGTLILKLDSQENLNRPLSVAVLRYTIAHDRTDLAKTGIRLSVKDPKVMVAGAIVGTDSVAAHCDIYTLS